MSATIWCTANLAPTSFIDADDIVAPVVWRREEPPHESRIRVILPVLQRAD